MLELLDSVRGRPLNLLCLGAHCDDIEIGCGAAVRKILGSGRDVRVSWHVLSSNDARRPEAERGAGIFAADAQECEVRIQDFRNGYFPYVAAELKDYFETLKNGFDPDIVLTHYEGDRHQDHRTVSQLTWNTFRNHWILEYEIPKYDGDLGSPNFFIPISGEEARFKADKIVGCFETQQSKRWFEQSTFLSLMRLRGIECNAESGYAEAFYVRNSVFAS